MSISTSAAETFEQDNAEPLPAKRELLDAVVVASPDIPEVDGEDYGAYRVLAPSAVVSLVLGVTGFTAFLNWWLVAPAVLGLILGIWSLRSISQRPTELTGKPLAWAGTVLSGFCVVGGPSYLLHEWMTEVPEGYVRISYDDLQPGERMPEYQPPQSAFDVHGKDVFIKGYVLAGNRQTGITSFILVRDQGDCCFGGNPKLTDRILVRLRPGQSFTYTNRLQKIIGRFQVKPAAAIDVAGNVIYQLEGAEIL